MGRPCATFLAVGALLTAGAALAADGPPHGLGLLAGRVTDDAALEKLKVALADPRPDVRAAAVRVINVSGAGPLVPAVADALARESDVSVAFEMIRFLASIRHPQADADAIAAARRLGEPVHKALADALGRQGASAAAHVASLRALGVGDAAWRMFFRLGVSGDGAGGLARIALDNGDPKTWRIVLDSLRRARVGVDPGVAAAAVRSPEKGIRTATYWHLALTFDPARPFDAGVASALDASPEAAADGMDQAALAYEVLDRRRGRPAQRLAAAIKALGSSLPEEMPRQALDSEGLLKLFDKDEQKALGVAFFGDEKAIAGRDVFVGRRLREGSALVVETPRGFPTGYVSDTVRAAGCDQVGWGGLLGGEATYGPDGRPANVGVVQREATKECLEAARALLVSALAPLGVPSPGGRKSLLLLPDDPGFLECLDRASNVPAERLDERASGPNGPRRIKEPRKVRDVKPKYPDAARAARAQGNVILEATIAPTGCVQGVSLLRGVHTDLDLEAIRAVSGWGYEPGELDGKPVPIFLTVTVGFKLTY